MGRKTWFILIKIEWALHTIIAWSPIFLLVLAAQAADVSTPLRLDPSGLTEDQQRKLKSFIDEANSRLPQKMKEVYQKPISVIFTSLGDASADSKLEIPCGQKEARKVNLGFKKAGDDSHIYIDKGFIDEIEKGPLGSRRYECGHGNYYTEALGTVLHEAAHIYDSQLNASGDDFYRALTGWDSSGRLRNNLLTLNPEANKRSPDAYEYYNPNESFAVNAEYFLLDPEYRCRRPAVWKWFAKLFAIESSQTEGDCKKFEGVQVEGEEKLVKLDPKRIYQVQYLVADPGSELMSRWGHSMLRLIVCDESRQKPGPECLKDVSSQIIVSYRANVSDIKTSMIGGVFGKYPSQLYFLRMNSILEDYGRKELRDLRAFPLKMSDEQKGRLADYLREQYWGYQGKYKFLTNNCATEMRNVIKQAYQNKEVSASLGDGIISPLDLQNLLSRTGLLEDVDKADINSQIENGYLYPSKQRSDLETAFAQVRELIPEKYGSLDAYLENSTASERKKLIEARDQELKQNPKKALSMFVLELQFGRLHADHLQKAMADLSEKNKTDVMQKSIAIQRQLQPWNRLKLDAKYGVPSEDEINPCVMSRVQNEFKPIGEQLNALFSATYPVLQDESNTITQNIQTVMKYFELLGTPAPTSFSADPK